MEKKDINVRILRKALKRRKAPAVDTSKAWEKCVRHIDGSDARNDRYVKILRIIISMAAMLVFVFEIWHYLKPEKVESESILIYTSQKKEAKGISVTYDNNTIFTTRKTVDYDSMVKSEGNDTVKIATPYNSDICFDLPDGTKVWLNNDSELEFPKSFNGGSRTVHLKGEAYFDVIADAEKPFYVNGGRMSVKVTGTSFDVNLRKPSHPFVVLLEGHVEAQNIDTDTKINVHPGEKAEMWKDGTFICQAVNAIAYVQWKDGFFYFEDSSLREVMCEIGRWYNVSVVVENPDLIDKRLHFVAERSSSLSSIVKDINGISGIKMSVEDGVLIIK